MNTVVQFDRHFQVWLYTVGHARLLFRSTKTESIATQVDVLFKNVSFMQCPVSFETLIISETTKNNFLSLGFSAGSKDMDGQKFFVIEGRGWRGFVAAERAIWNEDGSDHWDDSSLITDAPGLKVLRNANL